MTPFFQLPFKYANWIQFESMYVRSFLRNVVAMRIFAVACHVILSVNKRKHDTGRSGV